MKRKILVNIISSNNSVRKNAFNRLYPINTLYNSDLLVRLAIGYNLPEKVLKKYINKKIQFSKHVKQVRKRNSNSSIDISIKKEICLNVTNYQKSRGTSGTGPRGPKI